MVRRGVLLIAAAIASFFISSPVFAEGTEISIDVSAASLQLTVPSSANITLTPTTSGAFGDREIVFRVATNNPTGYTTTISVPQTDMIHSTITGETIPTLESTTTEGNFPANKWGYKTTADYKPVSLSNQDASWNGNGPTNGADHSFTIAAKIDNATTAGTYTNTLLFQTVANPNAPRDTIIFNGNGADSGTMTNQAVFQGETTKLKANAYTRSGYYFNGWNTYTDASGVGYGDEDNFVSTVTGTPKNITLYAQWVPESQGGSGPYSGRTLAAAYEQAYVYNTGQYWDSSRNVYKKGLYVPDKDPVTGEYTGTYREATQESDYYGIPSNDLRFAIQDIDLLVDGQKVCDRTTVIGSEAYVLDLRDFKSYHIVKMLDGRCWMQDNLALDLVATKNSLSPDNTNASTATLNYLKNGGGTDNYARTGIAYWGYGSIYYERPFVNVMNIDKVQEKTPSGTEDANWPFGAYYNYCAASAGSYCYETNAGVDDETTAIDAKEDICPKGWRLPTGGVMPSEGGQPGGGEYQSLNRMLGLYGNFVGKLHLPFSGVVYANSGNPDYVGSYGDFWTATFSTADNMNLIAVSYSQTSTNNAWNRWRGYTVRCINKQ